MTASAHIVGLAVEYLDAARSDGAEATLVGMHWYIDGRNKTLPLLDEVNQALQQRPEFRVLRRNGDVVFSRSVGDQTVTSSDMELADRRYRSEFSRELRKMRGDA